MKVAPNCRWKALGSDQLSQTLAEAAKNKELVIGVDEVAPSFAHAG